MKASYALLALLIIILSVTAVYSNSLDVPFQFDDVTRITGVRAAQVLDLGEIFQVSKSRFLLFVTFAINFHFGGDDVFGYHLLNLFIHIISSFLVFLICLSIFKPSRKDSYLLSLFSALIFALHPIQTGAVTYIWQRGESMAAMFYLFSIVMYVKFRLKGNLVFYTLCLISAVLCSLIKPTSWTLPLAILLYEIYFLSKDPKEFKKSLKSLAPIFIFMMLPVLLAKLDIGESKNVGIKVSSYYMPYYYTKLRVLANALRLIFLPINQRIEYDFAWSTSLTEPVSTFYSLILHLSLIATAIFSFRRYRLISFFIVWFYLTLFGTTILFLDDLFFEHYLYPTLFAYALVLPVFSMDIASRMRINKKWWVGFLVVLLAVYSLGTYNRNKIWQTEISLWEDAVKKSPNHARANYILGAYYFKAKRYEEAFRQYKLALLYKPEYPEAYYRLGEYYFALGDSNRSIINYKKAIEIKPEFFEAHLNLGSVYLYLKDHRSAEIYFQNALKFTNNVDSLEKIKGILREIRRHE